MIWDAEKRGLLQARHARSIEPTSGNTGIALAFVCASRGYQLTLTMPETMSLERRKVLAAFGANLILTPGPEGMTGAIRAAEEIAASEPGKRYFMPQQFKNPANPAIHERTTGPEIWDDTDGAVDVLVSGVGTGGTITGVSRYIKNTRGKADPLGRRRAGEEPGDHADAGRPAAQAGAAQDPGHRRRLRSRRTSISPWSIASSRSPTRSPIEMARRLAREEGILSGISCGAAASRSRCAWRASRSSPARPSSTILPDSGERYLSTVLFGEG